MHHNKVLYQLSFFHSFTVKNNKTLKCLLQNAHLNVQNLLAIRKPTFIQPKPIFFM